MAVNAGSSKINSALIALCVAVALSAVTWKAWDMFGPTHKPMLQGWNDSFYYYWLPAVVLRHDLDFAHPLATSNTVLPAAREAGLAMSRTVTGRLPNKYPPGWALGSLPFFLVGKALAPSGATGFEPIFLVAVWLGQMLYATAGLCLAVLIIRRLVPGISAIAVVLSVWLASPLVYYQTARVSLSHSQLFTLAMVVFWWTLRISNGDDRKRSWAMLGLASALMVITRNIAIVYLTFPVALLYRNILSARNVVSLLLGAAAPIAVQMVAWKVLFGSWIAYSYGEETFDFAHLHVTEVLFSPWHGFFYWHPLMLVGIAAVGAWSMRQPMGWAWLLSFGAITLLNAAWPCWWFASSFGNRGFEIAIFFAMVGIAALLQATRERPAWRGVVISLVVLAAMWNLLLFALFLTRRIPNEEPVTFAQAGQALACWVAEL